MPRGRGGRGWGWGGSLTPFSPLTPNPSPPPPFVLQWFLCPRRGRGESERNDTRMNTFFGFHQPSQRVEGGGLILHQSLETVRRRRMVRIPLAFEDCARRSIAVERL